MTNREVRALVGNEMKANAKADQEISDSDLELLQLVKARLEANEPTVRIPLDELIAKAQAEIDMETESHRR